MSVYSQAHLNKVARQLNERPRKTLGFETPAEKFNACVASTGEAASDNGHNKMKSIVLSDTEARDRATRHFFNRALLEVREGVQG